MRRIEPEVRESILHMNISDRQDTLESIYIQLHDLLDTYKMSGRLFTEIGFIASEIEEFISTEDYRRIGEEEDDD